MNYWSAWCLLIASLALAVILAVFLYDLWPERRPRAKGWRDRRKRGKIWVLMGKDWETGDFFKFDYVHFHQRSGLNDSTKIFVWREAEQRYFDRQWLIIDGELKPIKKTDPSILLIEDYRK